MKNSFINNIVKYSVPSIFSFLLGTLSAAILTRIFTAENYGIYNIFNTTVSLVLAMAYLGLDSAYIRFYNEIPNGITKKNFGYSLLISSICISTIIGIVCCFFWKKITIKLFGYDNFLLYISIFFSVLSQILIRYYSIHYRMEFNTKAYSIVTIATQLVNKVVILVIVFFVFDINKVIFISSVGFVIFAVFLSVKRKNIFFTGTKKISFKRLTEVYKFALFAAPIPLIINLISFIDQRIVINFYGNKELGIYSSVNYFVTLLNVIQSGFTTFWAAYMYANYKEKQNEIKKVHSCILILVIIFYYLLIIFKDVLFLLIGEEFYASKKYMQFILFYPLMILLCETTGYGINLAKKNYLKLITYCITLLTNIFASVIFANMYGIKGVALGSAAAGGVYYILNTIWGQKYYKSIKNGYKSLAGISGMVAIMLLSENKIVISILCFSLCIIFHSELKEILLLLLKKTTKRS